MVLELRWKSNRVVVIEMPDRDDSKGLKVLPSFIVSTLYPLAWSRVITVPSFHPRKIRSMVRSNGPERAVYVLKQTRNSLQYSRKHGLRCRGL